MKKLLANLVLVGAVSAPTLAFGGDISITGGATKSVVGSQDEVFYEWTDTANPGMITIPEGGKLVDILLVGGGGAGGFCRAGGGGGGGVIYQTNVLLPAGTYTVTVGAGGVPDSHTEGSGDYSKCYQQDQTSEEANGASSQLEIGGSVFAVSGVSFEAFGGGGGGNYHDKKKNVQGAGLSGACGGGAAANFQTATEGIPGQGFAGGKGLASNEDGAGGGGAGAAGADAPSKGTAGNGGAGFSCTITGASVTYGGGGGGGSYNGSNQALGGAGGGGLGGSKTVVATAGENGLGGGGGGASGGGNSWDMCGGGAGGSGVVIIRALPEVVNPPTVSGVKSVTTPTIAKVKFSATLVSTGTKSDGVTPSENCKIYLATGTNPDVLTKPDESIKTGWTLDDANWELEMTKLTSGADLEFGVTYAWKIWVENADGAAIEPPFTGTFRCLATLAWESLYDGGAGEMAVQNGKWKLTFENLDSNNPKILAIELMEGATDDGELDVTGLYKMNVGYKCTALDAFWFWGTDTLVKKLTVSTGTYSYLFCGNFTDRSIPGMTSLMEIRTDSVTDPHRISVKRFEKDNFRNCPLTGDYQFVDLVTLHQNGNTFYGCANLTSVVLNGSYACYLDMGTYQMGNSVFQNCTSLTNVAFVTTGYINRLMGWMFAGDVNLKSATINGVEIVQDPNIVVLYERQNFKDCSSYCHDLCLTNCQELGANGYSFENSGITSVALPKVTALGSQRAFSGCNGLVDSPYIPNVTQLRATDFYYCENLKSFVGMGVELLGGNIFEGCASLEEVVLPKVASLGAKAFLGCTSLKRVVFGGDSLSVTGTEVFRQGMRSDGTTEILWNMKTLPAFQTSGHNFSFGQKGTAYVRKEAGWTTMNDQGHAMVAEQVDGEWYWRIQAGKDNIQQHLVFMDTVVKVNVIEDDETRFTTLLPAFTGQDVSYTVPRSYALLPWLKFATVESVTDGAGAQTAQDGDELRVTVPASVLPTAVDGVTQDLTVNISVTSKGPTPTPKTGLLIIVR